MIFKSWVFYIGTIIAQVIFRIVGANRFSHPLRWTFLVGIVFGFCSGPLYLILHVKKKIRESTNWRNVSEGANIGMAILGASCAIAMDILKIPGDVLYGSRIGLALREPFNRTGMGGFFPFHLVFAWIYGSAIIVLLAARSLPRDRVKWRYGLNGFVAGMSFGPFGIYFKRCYPEIEEDKQARENFHGGFSFGVIFVLTIVNLVTSSWGVIRYSPY